MKRANQAKGTAPRRHRSTDEHIAEADKPCDPPIACGTMAPPEPGRDFVAMAKYESPIEHLGRKLVDAAIARLEHCDPDRAVTLTNAYIALVTEDERARA